MMWTDFNGLDREESHRDENKSQVQLRYFQEFQYRSPKSFPGKCSALHVVRRTKTNPGFVVFSV